MKVYLQHPGVNWSLSDVFDGLGYGLTANGAEVVEDSQQADWIIVVNGNLHDPEKLKAWRQHCPVAVLCTESPYDFDQEVERIAVVDGGWTHERLSVEPLRAVNPRVSYLPHAWHPERHTVGQPDPSVPAHDVVFVGSAFSERCAWFNAIDWTGIDLGLYGLWRDYGLDDQVEQYIRQEVTPNAQTVALYRRAKIGLNLYRTKAGVWNGKPRADVKAESLNPRAYELAACGVFQLSTAREEVDTKFGLSVARLTGDPKRDEGVIRYWLNSERDELRAELAKVSRKAVAQDTWTNRAAQVLADLHAWSTVTV